MKKNFFDVHDTGKFFLWVLATPQLLALMAEILLILIAPAFGTTAQEALKIPALAIAFGMLAQIAFLIVLLLFNKKFDIKRVTKLIPKIGIRNTLLGVAIGTLGVFSLSPIVGWFDKFLSSIGFSLSTIGFEVTSIPMLVLAIILVALIPAVLEEIVFRGAILQGLKKFGKWAAIFGTSALFVLIHGNLQQVIYPFVLSVILCVFVLKTNSVASAIITHFTSNALTLILSYIEFGLDLPLWASVLVALAGTGVMLTLAYLGKNIEKPRNAKDVLKEIEKPSWTYNNNASLLKIAIVLATVLFACNVYLGFMPN